MITAANIQITAVFHDGIKEVKTPVLVWKLLDSGVTTGMVVYGQDPYLELVSNIPGFVRYELASCP